MGLNPGACAVSLALHGLAAGAFAWSLGGGEPAVVRLPSGPDPLTLPLGGVYALPAPAAGPAAEAEAEPAPAARGEPPVDFPLPDLAHLLPRGGPEEPAPPPLRCPAGPEPPAPGAPVLLPVGDPPVAAASAAAAPSFAERPGVVDGVPVVERVPPEYPPRAVRQGQEGTVLLRVDLDAAGLPLAVAVERSSGHRLLDQAALAAVRRWRFAAGRAGRILQPVRFRLADA